MTHSTTNLTELAKLAREHQTAALHELRQEFRRILEEEPTVDELDLLRAALAEYVTAGRMLEAHGGC